MCELKMWVTFVPFKPLNLYNINLHAAILTDRELKRERLSAEQQRPSWGGGERFMGEPKEAAAGEWGVRTVWILIF